MHETPGQKAARTKRERYGDEGLTAIAAKAYRTRQQRRKERLSALEQHLTQSARLRDELLNGEIFYSLKEARIVIEEWRRHYNTVRPHSSLGWRPPAPEAVVLVDQRPAMH